MDNEVARVTNLHVVPDANNIMNALDANSQIIDAIQDVTKKDPSIWISKRGIKFQLKMISSRVGMEVANSIKMPEVPTFTDEEGRVRENPNDPGYFDARQQANISKGLLVMQANIGLGTTVLSVPESVEPVNSQNWSDQLDELTNGVIKVPAGGTARYLAWINYYALVGNEAGDLNNEILRYSGVVMEADVKSASENFSSDETRDTTEGLPPTTESES